MLNDTLNSIPTSFSIERSYQFHYYKFSMLKEMSSAVTECVSAPLEMYVTPQPPIACTVSIVTLPEASVSTLSPIIPTASFMASRVMLSSMMRQMRPVSGSGSAATTAMASLTSSNVRASSSISSLRPLPFMYSLERVTAAVIPPAAATWLSLIMSMSYRPMRWFSPPPISTAHLSSTRSPGTVLRVSKIRAGLAASAMIFVAVAMPLMRCMKLSATRSAVSSAMADPFTVPNFMPYEITSPSDTVHSTLSEGSTSSKTISATDNPAIMPSAFAKKVAVAWVSAGIVE
mmetsp:Transcript_12779/g.21688  ORF Transcript_12779/g.21688 Transcript_12779/m.21688 type:complete len:288 (+) Transcript_12779:52-915(+)